MSGDERMARMEWHLCWGDGPLVVSWVAPPRRSAAEHARQATAEHHPVDEVAASGRSPRGRTERP